MAPVRSAASANLCLRWDGRWKLLITLTVILAGMLIPLEQWPLLGVLGVVIFVGHSLAEIPLAYVLRRLAVFEPAVFLMSISVPLVEGFQRGGAMMLTMLLRANLSFLAVLWLVRVMAFPETVRTLRRLRVPETLVSSMVFMHRYVAVLFDEMLRMRQARRARQFGRRGLWFHWKTLAQLVGVLFIRAMDRAERVHAAMAARGWDGQVRVLDDEAVDATRRDHRP